MIEIKGAERLAALSRQIKNVGSRELRRKLNVAIASATAPLVAEAQRSVRSIPTHGSKHTGLRSRIAGAVKKRRRSGGISIIVSGLPAGLESVALQWEKKGAAAHPVFGNRQVWAKTSGRKKWFTQPLKRQAPPIRLKLLRAMDEITREIR